MQSLLLLAPARMSTRNPHLGALFDAALIETLRTLSEPRPDLRVFVPWSDTLAPLVSVATLDSSPSFDPESGTLLQATLMPYFPDSQEMSEPSRTFWHSSFLSLSGEQPRSFGATLESGIDTILALGVPQFDPEQRGALRRAKVLFFSELVERDAIEREVGGQAGTMIDLSADYSRDTLRSDRVENEEREWEESLEPFVPFGLLLQRWLNHAILSLP